MTITQVLDELSGFTFEERQLLIRHALELDEPPFEADEALIKPAWLLIMPQIPRSP